MIANNMGGASNIFSIGILRFAFSGSVKFINNTGSALRVYYNSSILEFYCVYTI